MDGDIHVVYKFLEGHKDSLVSEEDIVFEDF
jgi:hypothetical protein